MAEIDVCRVDERESSWEDDIPRFRVYLHGSAESWTGGWTDTYDVTGADVLQVIDWAQRQAGTSLTYAVALVHEDRQREHLSTGDGRGPVWLIGMDGNDQPKRHLDTEKQQRMLTRRREPISLPPADRMPSSVPDPATSSPRRSQWAWAQA
jgi:hypothetical protein